jgi:hypothetical protein
MNKYLGLLPKHVNNRLIFPLVTFRVYGLVKNLNLLERLDLKSKLLKIIISIKFITFWMNLLIPYSIKKLTL